MNKATPLPDLVAALEAHRAGRLSEAANVYAEAIALNPTHADALNLLAVIRRSEGDGRAAVDLGERAAAAAPERADIRYNLGTARMGIGDHEGAVAAFREALAIDPGFADAAANLGIALVALDRHEEAVAAYEQALVADGTHKIARLNLGNLLSETGRYDEGAQHLRRCADLYPDLAEAHYNLAMALLRLGDLRQGFAEYEWRWRTPGFTSPVRHARIKDWDGRPFAGASLLVHAEQGLGDTIQFLRFLPLAASLGGRVTLEVQPALARLAKGISGVDRLVAAGSAVGRQDWQSPLMGLPHRLGLSLGAIPAAVPYLQAEPERVAFWRTRLKPDGRPLVGVCWQGNRASPVDKGRSLPDAGLLAPLADVADVRLVSLVRLTAEQTRPAPTPTGRAVADLPFTIEYPGADYDAGEDAFVDTAAVLSLCDHVVTTDTAIAHLAGALGRPGLVLLKAVAEWRWLIARRDTPWYPTLRLVRQTRAGDFAGAIDEAARLLSARLAFRSVAGAEEA
ncbi:MAG: tetratricopeptide repeat protein [Labrys sp. (in: a-proteobacteria)]